MNKLVGVGAVGLLGMIFGCADPIGGESPREFYIQATNLWAKCQRDDVKRLADQRIKKRPNDITAWLVRASWDYAYADAVTASNDFVRLKDLSKTVNTPTFGLYRDFFLAGLKVYEFSITQRRQIYNNPKAFDVPSYQMEFMIALDVLSADGLYGEKHAFKGIPINGRYLDLAQLNAIAKGAPLETLKPRETDDAEVIAKIVAAVPKFRVGSMMCVACQKEFKTQWCKTEKTLVKRWSGGNPCQWKLRQQFRCPIHGCFGRECMTEYREGIPEGPYEPIREIPAPIDDMGL